MFVIGLAGCVRMTGMGEDGGVERISRDVLSLSRRKEGGVVGKRVMRACFVLFIS